MKFVSSFERLAKEEGEQLGEQKGIASGERKGMLEVMELVLELKFGEWGKGLFGD